MVMNTVAPGALEGLKSKLRGDLVFPGDVMYDAGRSMHNGRFDRRPSALARCTGVADIQTAVRYARERNVPFSVRGGGQEVDGWAMVDDALALDLSPMNGVIVNPASRRAIVQAGSQVGILDRETAVHGLAVTAGAVSNTGVAGLALGGGVGWLMRKYGAMVDSVVGIDAVTAEGEVVHASAVEHPDLLWGMRGGSGNFAIATAFHFQLHPLPPTILAGAVVHAGEGARAKEWLRFWRDYMLEAPDEVGSNVVLLRAPTKHWPPELAGKPLAVTMFAYAGDLSEGERVLKPVREWGAPIADSIAPIPYTSFQQTFETSLPQRLRKYMTGGYVPELTDGFVERAVDMYASAPTAAPGDEDLAVFALWAFGGEISRIPEETAAFPRGGAAFHWENIGVNAHAEDDKTWIDFVDDVDRVLRPLGGPQVYLNHYSTTGKDQSFMKYAYGPEKYARLVEIKDRWDPTNVFRFNKNIEPSV